MKVILAILVSFSFYFLNNINSDIKFQQKFYSCNYSQWYLSSMDSDISAYIEFNKKLFLLKKNNALIKGLGHQKLSLIRIKYQNKLYWYPERNLDCLKENESYPNIITQKDVIGKWIPDKKIKTNRYIIFKKSNKFKAVLFEGCDFCKVNRGKNTLIDAVYTITGKWKLKENLIYVSYIDPNNGKSLSMFWLDNSKLISNSKNTLRENFGNELILYWEKL